MAYSPPSDLYLLLAFWTGIGALALTLAIALQIVLLRLAGARRRRREAALTALWRPLLNAAIAGDAPADLPPLATRDGLSFLKLWLHLQQAVRGPAGEHLNALARRAGCEQLARRLLARGGRAERLLAILALGHLRDAQSWSALRRMADSADSAASVHALWALSQIDAARAAQDMAPALLRRADWPLPQLAQIVQPARAVWQPVLAQALHQLAPDALAPALQLLAALRLELPPAQLERYLAGDDGAVLPAALRLARSPATLAAVRRHADSPDWRIRLQAVRALGELGERADVARLVARLSDGQWWVRYRAAQALLALPCMTQQELAALAAGSDRYAADMLAQVRAERAAA